MRKIYARMIAIWVALFMMILLLSCKTEKNEPASEAGIFVTPVENLPENFINGTDVSSVLSLEQSGVKFYNFDGEEQDLFKTLAQAGINCVRVRVWNDPFDEYGHVYGGGNCDAAAAAEIEIKSHILGIGRREIIDAAGYDTIKVYTIAFTHLSPALLILGHLNVEVHYSVFKF